MKNALKLGPWISWEVQTRNRSMASALGVPLVELLSSRPRLLRYAILMWKTTCLLWRYRGHWVFVQNPSIVLATWTLCLKPVLGLKVVVDFHNSGLFPLEGKSRLLLMISRLTCRWADLSVVTNSSLAEVVENRKGRACIVTDPLNEEEFFPIEAPQTDRAPYLLFVCSWSEDEPWEQVLEAVKHTVEPFTLNVTGNYKKRLSSLAAEALPGNVKLLGFVEREEYIRCLQGASLMLDLTNRDHCLVCGAYEAVAAEVPMLLSDTKVNREVFPKGAVYTENQAKPIAKAIDEALQAYAVLSNEVKAFKAEYRNHSQQQIGQLKAQLQKILLEEH